MTTVQLELWQLITLLLAFFTAVGIAARVFMAQMIKSLDDRFNALNSRMTEDGKTLQRLERDFFKLQAELPNTYVRREDYARNQTIIELKIDRLGDKIMKVHST